MSLFKFIPILLFLIPVYNFYLSNIMYGSWKKMVTFKANVNIRILSPNTFILLQTIFLFNIISWIARDGVESDLDKDFTY